MHDTQNTKIFKKFTANNIFISKKLITLIAVLYVYIPIVLFLLAWVKLYISIPVILICGYIGFEFLKSEWKKKSDLISNECNDCNGFSISPLMLLIFTLAIVGIAHLCGFDGFVQQSSDWGKHNGIMHDLMNYSWPVYYTEYEDAMLTYYIAQYLVPSLFGKLFNSYNVAYIVLFVWNSIGILILGGLVFTLTKASSFKKQLVCILLLFSFSGMQVMADYLNNIFVDSNVDIAGNHMFWFMQDITAGKDIWPSIQYRSFFVCLRWVFPQFIVPNIALCLWLAYKDKVQYYVFILMPVMLYATFQFLGLVIVAVVYAAVLFIKAKKKSKYLIELFGYKNILVLITLGTILLIYLMGNVVEEKPESTNWMIFNMFTNGKIFLQYIIFCVTMFGFYAATIFSNFKKKTIYYITVAMLTLIPWIRMGMYNDFSMCVSMIPLFMMFLMILQFLFEKAKSNRHLICKSVLVVMLCIGSLASVQEAFIVIRTNTPGKQLYDYETMSQYTELDNVYHNDDVKYNYYTYNPEESLFVRFLAKNEFPK